MGIEHQKWVRIKRLLGSEAQEMEAERTGWVGRWEEGEVATINNDGETAEF